MWNKMVEQRKFGPYTLDDGKIITFIQNPTTNGFSDGYSIRYSSTSCVGYGYKNGWTSLGTVKETEIETTKKTLQLLIHLISSELGFIEECKKIYRKNISTVKINVGGERRVNSEWLPLINSFIDELYEKENDNLQEKLEKQSILLAEE